jgi:hypothetical protein
MNQKRFSVFPVTVLSLFLAMFLIVFFSGGCSAGVNIPSSSTTSSNPTSTATTTHTPAGTNVRTVRIYGTVPTSYGFNRVGIFTGSSAIIPYEAASVSTADGSYEIHIGIPDELNTSDSTTYTADMRFYAEENFATCHSQCHFLTYSAATGVLQLQVYGGSTYDITGTEYNYVMQ